LPHRELHDADESDGDTGAAGRVKTQAKDFAFQVPEGEKAVGAPLVVADDPERRPLVGAKATIRRLSGVAPKELRQPIAVAFQADFNGLPR